MEKGTCTLKTLTNAINGLQLTCMRSDWTFADLAKVRKELIAAIRATIVESTRITVDPAEASPKTVKATQEYLAKFDKLMSPE